MPDNRHCFSRANRRRGRLVARQLIALAAVALAIVAAVWWRGRQAARPEVAIGLNAWPGYLPFFVAQEKGYFREQGVSLKLVMYTNFNELSRDYVAGKLQARGNLTFDAVQEALQGLGHKAVLVIDYSRGADAIVARLGLHDISALSGQRVGYEPGTMEEFFLAFALSEHGASLHDVISVLTTSEHVLALLRDKQIDAAVIHEPFLTSALKEGIAHTIYSTRAAPGLIADILTFRDDAITAHPNWVKAILRAYFQGLAFWKQQPKEAQRIAAKACGATPEEIAAQLLTISFLDERDNDTALTFSTSLDLKGTSLSLYGNLRQVGEFVLSHQSGPRRELDTDRLIDRRFIRAVMSDASLHSRRGMP